MYYEDEKLILVDLGEGVKEQLSQSEGAFMATTSRSKSFKILQYMKKHFPDYIVEREINDSIYLISIREKHETV